MTRSGFFGAHDPRQLEIWQKATIGIAGAGGLGSNIAIALTRAGIGRLIIADFDIVSPSNLNRQQYFMDQIGEPKVEALRHNLERISPYTKVEIFPEKLNPTNLNLIFNEAQIMLEAFDLADQKAMLLEAWTAIYPERHLIAASGIAGVGSGESIKIDHYGKLHIIGDGISELSTGISPVSARVAIVAAMQANLCLELLLKESQ